LGRVFITGVGVISSIGNTAAENHEALIGGKCGLSKLTHIASRYAGVLPFGEVLISTENLREKLQVKEPGVTRTTLLALHAVDEAIIGAGLTPSEITSPDTALVGATTVGGMCLMDELYHDASRTSGGSEFLSSYDCASVYLFLQAHYKISGIVNTINTACSSSANAIMYGARLIKNKFAKRAIVGGADSLSKFTINGFNALRLLSPEICTPFDENRQGLNLGEGAAFLVLEREEDVANKKVYAELTGYFNSSDAFHPSSLSDEGDGPFEAMEGALAMAKTGSDEIDFINAHGTATPNNDEAESRAMIRVFGKKVPSFASVKSNIGHTLGAAGAIGAVYSIFSLGHQEVYPAIHFKQPIVSTSLVPIGMYQKVPLRNVMSNSFGFGGNCTSLIFSKS
jgi:3-oxoacyl-(acyl-carrier-protein) synthase